MTMLSSSPTIRKKSYFFPRMPHTPPRSPHQELPLTHGYIARYALIETPMRHTTGKPNDPDIAKVPVRRTDRRTYPGARKENLSYSRPDCSKPFRKKGVC